MFQRRAHFRVEIVEEIFPRNAHAQPLCAFLHCEGIVRNRNLRRCDVCGIVARDRLQHDGGISDIRSQWTDVIER